MFKKKPTLKERILLNEIDETITPYNTESCPICLDSNLVCPVKTKCNHMYCAICIDMHLNSIRTRSSLKCPMCNTQIVDGTSYRHAFPVSEEQADQENDEVRRQRWTLYERFITFPESISRVIECMGSAAASCCCLMFCCLLAARSAID